MCVIPHHIYILLKAQSQNQDGGNEVEKFEQTEVDTTDKVRLFECIDIYFSSQCQEQGEQPGGTEKAVEVSSSV
jgi:hypothetical protein